MQRAPMFQATRESARLSLLGFPGRIPAAWQHRCASCSVVQCCWYWRLLEQKMARVLFKYICVFWKGTCFGTAHESRVKMDKDACLTHVFHLFLSDIFRRKCLEGFWGATFLARSCQIHRSRWGFTSGFTVFSRCSSKNKHGEDSRCPKSKWGNCVLQSLQLMELLASDGESLFPLHSCSAVGLHLRLRLVWSWTNVQRLQRRWTWDLQHGSKCLDYSHGSH